MSRKFPRSERADVLRPDYGKLVLTAVNGKLHVWHAYNTTENWDALHAALDLLCRWERAKGVVEGAMRCAGNGQALGVYDEARAILAAVEWEIAEEEGQ